MPPDAPPLDDLQLSLGERKSYTGDLVLLLSWFKNPRFLAVYISTLANIFQILGEGKKKRNLTLHTHSRYCQGYHTSSEAAT